MPNVALFKQDGSQNGEITLNEEIFGIEPNETVVYDAIIMQRASLRRTRCEKSQCRSWRWP